MMLLCPPQGADPSHFARKKRDELKAHAVTGRRSKIK